MSYFVRSITRCRQEKREKEKKKRKEKKKTQRQRHATIALKVNLRLVQSRRQMEGGQIDLDGSVMVVLLQLQGGKGGGTYVRIQIQGHTYTRSGREPRLLAATTMVRHVDSSTNEVVKVQQHTSSCTSYHHLIPLTLPLFSLFSLLLHRQRYPAHSSQATM